MATIFMEATETGSVAWMTDATDASANNTVVAGPWSTYSWATVGNESKAPFTSSVSTFYGQARIRFTSASAAGRFMTFYSPNGTANCSIGINNATDRLEAYRGTSTLLGTGTTALSIDTWYYIQWKVVISDTVGEFVVKLAGANEINLSSQDTRNDAAAGGDTCSVIAVLRPTVGTFYFDDIIINDTTDTDNVSYPDNLGIEALMPNAAGDVTGLTRGGSDSGSNYGQVDERGPNDATDYVYDSVVDDYDLYNIPSTRWSSIASVQLALRVQKSDAGAANIAHIVKADTDANATADTEYTGSDIALGTSWEYKNKIYNRQPDSTSWTAAKVNALQVGAKVR